MTTTRETVVENEPKGITGWVFIFVSIGIILVVWLFVPSYGTTNQGEEVHSTSSRPTVQKIGISTTLSNPIYLPDPLAVQVVDFSCDIDEYGVLYDVLVNGKYSYGPIAKDQPVSIKETIRFVQFGVSAESPAKTGTMRYSIVPRTAH
jgi:hypothetical protein